MAYAQDKSVVTAETSITAGSTTSRYFRLPDASVDHGYVRTNTFIRYRS